jgi:hypothetical protein
MSITEWNVSFRLSLTNFRADKNPWSQLFARDDHEANIVPHNALLLAYFRCHHCLEVVYSEQCIGYILKYYSKHSDARRILVQNVLYEGHSVSKVDKLQYHAATSVSSASECFAGICGYWRHHMKPIVVILGIHLPGKKVVLTASPADALKKVDIPVLLKDVSVADGQFV